MFDHFGLGHFHFAVGTAEVICRDGSSFENQGGMVTGQAWSLHVCTRVGMCLKWEIMPDPVLGSPEGNQHETNPL